VLWLYGSLGFVGFFVIYWTFSETEGRSLEDIEEFYKTGIRGKIPKRGNSEVAAKDTFTKFSSSSNCVTIGREGVSSNSDEDGINNTLFTVQHSKNMISKPHYSNSLRGGINNATSTETIDTALTVSASDLQDPKSSTGDVTEKKDDVQQVEEEKCDEKKVVVGENFTGVTDSEGKSNELKTVEDKCNKARAVKQNVDNKGENCIQEKAEVHSEADVEERTNM
jgi:hypothetical protein